MIEVTCIQRFQNRNNHITGYTLQDAQGNTQDAEPGVLKQAIIEGKIHVTNLELTADNRLILTGPEIRHIPKMQALKNFEAKQNMLGRIFDFETDLKTEEIFITRYYDVPNRKEVIIPGFIDGFKTHLSDNGVSYCGAFSKCKYIEKIIMGSNVTGSLEQLFKHFNGPKLDLTDFDTSNITSMNNMFCMCRAPSLILGKSFDTRNVQRMKSMFFGSTIELINLEHFNTARVRTMSNMFNDCRAKHIELGNNFYTNGVEDLAFMFCNCRAESLKLGDKFDTFKAYTMQWMFDNCKSQVINLGNAFDTSHTVMTKYMFSDCKAKKIIVGKHVNEKTIKELHNLTNIPIVVEA